MPTTFDLYFAGLRNGAASATELPADEAVAKIRHLLPWPHRLVRLPLRLTASVVRDQGLYQRLVMPYWLMLLRRSTEHHRAVRTA